MLLCSLLCCAESFSERRINLLRGAIKGTFFKPLLPAQLVENSEMCKVRGRMQAVREQS